MSSVLVHTAVFGLGAVVGVGVASTVLNKRQLPTANTSSSTALPTPVPAPGPPLVEKAGPTLLTAPSATTLAGAAGEVLKFGNPGPIADLLARKAYVAGYDRRLRHPAWTAEHLTAASLQRAPSAPGDNGKEKGDRSKSSFAEDESIPLPFRARLADYFRSGYDRGHMVPAADAKASQEGMDETFLLTNIAPQVGAGFNRHYWAYLEDYCRRLTSSFSDVYVFTIPLYLPRQDSDGKWRVTYEVIGNPASIAVPTHFAKVVLASGSITPGSKVPAALGSASSRDVALGAFVLPNAIIPDDVPLEKFSVPVDSVERAAGLTLLPPLLKSSATNICRTPAGCDLIIRKFDETGKLISEGKAGGARK